MSAAPKTNAREEFYSRLDTRSLAPLWERLKGLVPPEPQPKTKPFLWKWDDMRPMVLEAGGLLTAEEAERRVLVLENPAFPGMSRATNTLYAGVQLIMPGEVAPAHRHTQSALRFILESDGAYTAVGGERTTMRQGDFVITPAWAWHDHGNHGQGPAIWMDVLDLPLGQFLDTGFGEHHNDKEQSVGRPEDDALWRFGTGLMPMEGERPYGQTSPVFNYPYARTRPALVAAAKELDPHWAATLRFNNPYDGGWAMPTIATWMTHVPSGVRTQPMRTTDSTIVAVAEGRGSVTIGDTRMTFGPRDIVILPNWTWRSFEASEDLFLFCASDRVVHEKLGLYRQEKSA
ncbi:gentisate 1,2-dioxygenase [Roseomonas sp. CCTCC AB2023176]|uniref:gentisate 1,2-dioxygenase n=1 Tax=Roseomonas sp. CCTCC AB2023176 TaxID=3342640 RepID=UPI0035DCEAC4